MEWSAHLKYAFQLRPQSEAGRIFGSAYQGIGVGFYHVGNDRELGTPTTFYLFQGAPITPLSHRLTLDYNWEFGISFGWKPYDEDNNFNNIIIGSPANFYLNAGVYLNWEVSRYFDFSMGVSATHFSNGNTRFPNAGLNSIGLRMAVAYHFNRALWGEPTHRDRSILPAFPRHISYDLTLFGAWKKAGIPYEDKRVLSLNRHWVAGFSFSPMYNFNYRLRTGVSLDATYDTSTGLSARPLNEEPNYTLSNDKPNYTEVSAPFIQRIALGLSGRVEYTMPYFTVGVGMGRNIVAHRNKQSWYQMLYLKIDLLRNTYLHLGYSLQEFHNPNHLMLGVGYRFHNKYPKIRKK
jgi:hypothetical protein